MDFDPKFRSPRVGDTVRTAKPLQCDSLDARAGDYLRVYLATEASADEARKLVASGRWIVEPSSIDQLTDAGVTSLRRAIADDGGQPR